MNKVFRLLFAIFCFVCIENINAQVTLVTQTDLPMVIISRNNQVIPNSVKITAQMRVLDNPSGINSLFDTNYTYDGNIGIETRGSSSLIYPKQSYSVETRDQLGQNFNTMLLGFPTENDWIFNGPYDDKTLLRNHLALDLSRCMGNYAPRAKFCEIIMDTTVNNSNQFDYKGVYVLLERIKRDDDRVDISNLSPTEVDLPGGFSPDVTGGYIVQVDESSGSISEGWFSSFGGNTWNYLYTYPKSGDIVPQQASYIQGVFQNFETVMAGPNYNNPTTGYPSIIDENSFYDFIIMQELTKNVDGYRKSSYFFKSKDSKDPLIHAGPVWDFNLAFGNPAIYNGNSTTGFQYEFNQNFPTDQFSVPFYWEALMNDADFNAQLVCRYNYHRANSLSTTAILNKVDSLAGKLANAQQRNYMKFDVLGTIINNETPSTYNNYQESIDELKNWITARLTFLDAQWPGYAIDVTSANNVSACPGTIVTLNASGGETGSYMWEPDTLIVGSNTGSSIQVMLGMDELEYVVTGYSFAGCSDTAEITITPDGIASGSGGPDMSICAGESVTLQGSGALSYTWSPSNGLSNPNIANPVASPNVTTTYTVSLNTADCGTITDQVIVTVQPAPDLTVGPNQSICSGTAVLLSASANSFSSYKWTANPPDPTLNTSNCNSPNPTVSPTQNTTYTVEVTDGNTTCTNTATTTITVESSGTIDFGLPTEICAGESYEIPCPQINNIQNVVWSPNTGLSNPTSPCPIASPTQSTTYNATITTTDGCTFTGAVVINVTSGSSIYAGEDQTICNGNSLQLNATGGGNTIVWSPSNGLSNTNIANPIANPSQTTTYTVTSSTNGSCSSTDEITITVTNSNIDAGPDATLCSGGAPAQLNASGAISYSWNPPNGLSSTSIANPTASPSSTTTYTLTATDANNCVVQDEVTVFVNQLSFSVGDDFVLCADETGMLNANGGDSYFWSPATGLDNPFSSSPNIVANGLPIGSTTYTVTITEGDCAATAQQTVTVNAPGIVSNNVSICPGGETTLTASGGSNYTWSPIFDNNNVQIIDNISSANPTVSPTQTTTFTVIINDNNDCIYEEEVVVTVANSLVADAGEDQDICAGEEASLSASGGVTYSWSPVTGLSDPNISNPIVTINTSQTYTVTVSDGGSCTGTDMVNINVVDGTFASITGNDEVCEGETLSLTAFGGSTYSWSPVTGIIGSPNQSAIEVQPTSTITYTVTVSDVSGCNDTETITINVNSPPTVDAGSFINICEGGSVDLLPVVTGDIISYNWSPAAGLSNPDIFNPTANPTTNTVYTIVVTSDNGCTAEDQVGVSIVPAPNVTATTSNNSICAGENVQLNATGGVFYSWSPNTGLSNSNIPNPIAAPQASTTYEVTVTDSNDCTNTASVFVEVGGGLVTGVSPAEASICIGESVNLLVTGGSTYQWTNNTNTLSCTNCPNPVASPVSTTTYEVLITDANGSCAVAEYVTITVNPIPQAFAGPDQILCSGETTTLNANGGAIYQWTPITGLSDANIANPTVTVSQPITYTVNVSSAAGCSSSDEMTIDVNPNPIANAGSDFSICSDEIPQLNGSGAGQNGIYLWSPANLVSNPNISNPDINVNSSNTFVLQVTDQFGCTDTDEVFVSISSDPFLEVSEEISICVGGGTNLFAFASDAVSYSWSPSTYLNNPNIAEPICTPSSSISYTVTATNANGCSSSKTVVVFVDDELVLPQFENEQICLGGNVQLNATGGTTYNWSPTTNANGQSIIDNPNIANPTVSPTTTTTFTVQVSDGGSCNASAQVTVEVSSDELELAVSNTQSICLGSSTNLLASGASSYSWSPNDGSLSCVNCPNPVANPTITTTYTVTGTTGACSGTNQVIVNVNNASFATSITPDISICDAGNYVQLEATGGTQYLWSPSNGLDNPNIANPIAIPDETTTYTVVISNGNCQVTEMVTITVLDATSILPTNSVSICEGSNYVINFDEFEEGYQILPSSDVIYDGTTALLSPSEDVVYTITGTHSSGCAVDEQLNVFVIEVPAINAGPDLVSCDGTAVQLNGTGSGIIEWSPATGLSDINIINPIASPNQTTTYTLTVTTPNTNCTSTDQVTIEVSAENFAQVNSNVQICNGGSAQLIASGGVSYNWSPSSSLTQADVSNPVAMPSSATVYTVLVTDANGCEEEETVTVSVGTNINANAGNDAIICSDGNGTVLNASGGFTYSWEPTAGLSNPNIANPTANPDENTIYTLTITDGNNCEAQDFVSVTILDDNITPYAGEDITICDGEVAQLNATGGISYLWSPATGLSDPFTNNPLANPSVTTLYTVSMISLAGCTDFDEVLVTVDEPIPNFSIAPIGTICEGDSVQLVLDIDDDQYTYQWSPEIGLSDPTAQSPFASPNLPITYTVEITNEFGCSRALETEVHVIQTNQLSAGSDQVICLGESVQLQASLADSYLWSPNSFIDNISSATPTVNPQITTDYFVTMELDGCATMDTVSVEVIDFNAVKVSEDLTLCLGSSVTLSASGGSSYFWTSTDVINDPTAAEQTVSPTQATEYTVTIEAGNCFSTKVINVAVGPSTNASLQESYVSCSGAAVELNVAGTGIIGYSWSPSEGLDNPNIQSPIASVETTTTYSVEVFTMNQCVSELQTTVEVTSSIDIQLNANQISICKGESQNLLASGASTYSWSPALGLSSVNGASVFASPEETTTYTVTGIDATGACMGTNEILVLVTSLDEATAIDDVIACEGDEVELMASGGANYAWEPNDVLDFPNIENPKFTVSEAAIFTVLISEANCNKLDTVEVIIGNCDIDFVPNAFSPNNDLMNDYWVIPGIHRFPQNNVAIFNRWGQLVYQASNYQNTWEGTFNGVELPEATYYYVLDLGEGGETRQGTVNIIR